MSVQRLHHSAYRCRNSEQTRVFYEDFLGLPLVDALRISTTKTGRSADVLHTFYAMEDGACVAFFEEPDTPFDFKDQRDFDLHIALQVDYPMLEAMLAKGHAQGIDTRGISDHGFIHSVYFRDPNGYVVELTAPVGTPRDRTDGQNAAAATLAGWQAERNAG